MIKNDIQGIYTPGGRNVMSDRYDTGGYHVFEERPRFIGELSGSWYEMGVKYGKSCAELITASTDYWWGNMMERKGLDNTVRAMKRYIDQVNALDPTQIELLFGIAQGASLNLAQGKFGDPAGEFYANDFIRIFAASIFDCWLWGNPDSYRADSAAAYESAEGYINGDGCNSVAAKGKAVLGDHTISSQVRHTQQAGLCYQAAMVYRCEDCNTVWSVGNAPAANGLLLVNDKGVSISHHFGGSTTADSLSYRGGPYYGSAYGVPWPNLLFYAAKTANTAQEALEILKYGSSAYRQITGRKTVRRDGTWNWMVCDDHTLAVMEVSPDRYAIRYAGEYTGSEWTDPDYIVCANHFICPYSYDENGNRTDVPMWIFNSSSNSRERFWTLMWEMKDFYGKIDEYTLQYIFSQTYIRDEKTGEYVYALMDTDGRWLTAGQSLGCAQGKLENNGLKRGTNGAKIATLNKSKSECRYCLGNPKDWQGAWDYYQFCGK